MSPNDLYKVLSALVPQYITMLIAFASVRYWKIFSPEQCGGINRFVALIACPFLAFEVISRINPDDINLPFLAADSISKLLVLVILTVWVALFKSGSMEWLITIFSLATLPNTLIVGIPLLTSMYGNEQEGLMNQLIVVQCIVWLVFLVFLYELRAARNAIMVTAGENNAQLEISELQSTNFSPAGDCERSQHSCRMEDYKVNVEEKITEIGRFMMVKMIIKRVCFKLMKNPNVYASLLGILWVWISHSLKIKKPLIVENSIKILSNAGFGMAIFSLGLFMALQPKIIACGNRLAVLGMLIRFVGGPAAIAVPSFLIGLKNTTLRVAIVQAALPQAVITFVYAKEYDLNADLLSTIVIFSMIVSLPVTVMYYTLLSL